MLARAPRHVSDYLAPAVGLILLAVLVVATAHIVRRPKPPTPKVTVGTRDAVFYYRGTTEQSATALGDALRITGYFRDAGASVLLSKVRGVTCVSFVVNEDAWQHPATIAGFEEIGRRVADSIGGFPIQVNLVDDAWNIHKSATVGRARIGEHDVVYYLGAATEEEAKSLGEALKKAHYLEDRGVTVVLERNDATAVSFVVSAGVWSNPQALDSFVALARQIAPSIGGLPLHLRLLDANMEIEKDLPL